MSHTWEELKAMKSGTVLVDRFDDGVRVLILRGPGSLCAYFGIPLDHPLAGNSYDDLPIACHGGLTHAAEGDGNYKPKGYYWYGWDHAHAGDLCFFDGLRSRQDKAWLVEDIEKEIWLPLSQFRSLMKITEHAAQHLEGSKKA